jgi:GTP-binding protein
MDTKLFFKVEFITSIRRLADKPVPDLPEIVFAGRSNVGKSSLLNALCNRKNLARTSASPGKTQLINYYNVDNSLYFVDLPGYGFAKLSRSIRSKWPEMIETFLLENKMIFMICLLIDARHPLQKRDSEMLEWLQYHQMPFSIILTKIDKLSRKDYDRQISAFSRRFPDKRLIPFSINGEKYREELRKFLLSYLNNSI